MCDMSSWRPDSGPASGAERDAAAEKRDLAAEKRDRTANGRDAVAGQRDEAADTREEPHSPDAGASADRAAAGRDRRASAVDRGQAEQDRQASSDDRTSSADERAAALLDGLTGAHRRDPGVVELERALVQARRTGRPFTLAFIDVNGLKATNDAEGHAAGDRLLVDVATLIRDAVREDDLLVRYGGDEFLCGLLALDRAGAAVRFAAASASSEHDRRRPFSVGLAELGPEDTLADLIARADADMYRRRAQDEPGG